MLHGSERARLSVREYIVQLQKVVVGPSGEEKNGVCRPNASNRLEIRSSAMNGVQILRLFPHIWYTSNDIPTKLGQANYLSRIIGVQFVKCYAVHIGLSTQTSCKHLASVVVESNPCLTLSCKQSDACHDGQTQLEWDAATRIQVLRARGTWKDTNPAGSCSGVSAIEKGRK